MGSETVRRVSAWEVAFWLVCAVNTIVGVRDVPGALRFFGFWLVVAAIVGAVGSVVALLMVGFRRMTGSAFADTRPRIL